MAAQDRLDPGFFIVSIDKKEADSEGVRVRDRISQQPLALSAKELLRKLNEHACAVPGFPVGAHGPPVGEVYDGLHTLPDDFMTPRPVNVADEPHSAGG